MKQGKKYITKVEKVDRLKFYPLDEGLDILYSLEQAGFNETIEVAMNLGVDPRKADQIVRNTVVLPNGTGKSIRVLVFARGENEKIAKEAGADYIGNDDLAAKIQGGWVDFDIAITTPDMMSVVGKLGKVLGPRGLMPNPKSGTVTQDVARAVKEAKAGKIEFRVDKTGNIHVPIGKRSFDIAKIRENFLTLLDAVIRARPSAAKGTYLKSVTISSTMSPGVRLDRMAITGLLK